MDDKKGKSFDPLFQLFEHYLLNRSYEDSQAFTKEIAEEYMEYLDSSTAHVPYHTRKSVLEDLSSEAHAMLVKKMYGCVKSADYVNFGKVITIAKNEELETVDFTPPKTTAEESKKD
jgi:hypothetical protein